MAFQMMRVISSPSSSTIGLATLIFGMELRTFGWAPDQKFDGADRPRMAAGIGRRCYGAPAGVPQGRLCDAKLGGQAGLETLHRAETWTLEQPCREPAPTRAGAGRTPAGRS